MKLFLTAIVLLALLQARAQQSRLKLFIDCQQVYCDLDFIKREIPVVDFVRDRQGCDVHLLISTQPAGNGGQKYNLQLRGQQRFSNLSDTVSFFTLPAQTPDDIRAMMVSKIGKALVPFLLKAGRESK